MDGNVIGNILLPQNMADIFIYLIFFLSLLMLGLIPEKSQQSNYLMFFVIFLAVIDKIRQASTNLPVPGLDNDGFATLLLHVGLFIFPLIAAGLIRGTGRKDKRGVPVGLLIGLFGGLYAIGTIFEGTRDMFYNAIF
jgi:hypothetical protein